MKCNIMHETHAHIGENQYVYKQEVRQGWEEHNSSVLCHMSANIKKDETKRRTTNNYRNNKKYAIYRLIYYSKSALHVSGDVFAHHQEHLTVFTASGSVHPSCCQLVSRISWNWTMWIVRRTPHNPHSPVSTYSRHQLAATWVNTTRCCKYSQVLLMMGENIARNM